MSLERFINYTKNRGVSRDNRFTCGGDAIPRGLQDYVQSVALPGIQFHTGLYKNVGHAKKYINNTFYTDLTVTFLDTNDLLIQKYYVDWIKEIYKEDGSFAYKDTYTRLLTVTKLTREEGAEPIKYTFNKVFPSNISDVPLNTASQNTASQLTVTFSYDDWTI